MLAKKIRELREARGLSREELAGKMGVSPSLLAQVEEGKTVPSVATLIHLSRCLDVPLRTFTGLEAETRLVVVRAHERREVERRPKVGPSKSGYHYQTLASKEGIDAFYIIFEEKGEDERVFFQHDGKEFLYVLEGRLELCLDDQCVVLGPGDSASYDSKYPHSLRGVGGPARAVVVIYGE